MRIAVMGAGGVGGYFGAKLAAAGEEVVFVARGAHLAALRERGLRVETNAGEIVLDSAEATDDPASTAPADIILFCVKLYDAEAAAEACRPLLKPGGWIISLQNGVESVERVSAVLGEGRTLGGAAFIGARIEQPGVIVQAGFAADPFITFGAPDGSRPEAAVDFAARSAAAGFRATLVDDMAAALWNKFVVLGPTSALTALTRQPLGPIREDEVMRQALVQAVAETAAVGRALGVDLAEDIEEKSMASLDGLPAESKASQLLDLERGNRLEVDWLSGALHRLGKQTGVPTPAHSTVYAALRPFRQGTVSGS